MLPTNKLTKELPLPQRTWIAGESDYTGLQSLPFQAAVTSLQKKDVVVPTPISDGECVP